MCSARPLETVGRRRFGLPAGAADHPGLTSEYCVMALDATAKQVP
jgi:hypothetical protein